MRHYGTIWDILGQLGRQFGRIYTVSTHFCQFSPIMRYEPMDGQAESYKDAWTHLKINEDKAIK